jgi:hypothetical protein
MLIHQTDNDLSYWNEQTCQLTLIQKNSLDGNEPPALNTYIGSIVLWNIRTSRNSCDARITLHTLMLFYSRASGFPLIDLTGSG